MEKEKLEILRIVKNVAKDEAGGYVGLPSIDRRLLLKYPEIVFEGKLKDLIVDLTNHEFLVCKSESNSAVRITNKGVKYLSDQHG